MFSNLSPFICSNVNEFRDERNCLRDITFPKLQKELENLDINFDPFIVDWHDNDDYVKSGNLLRMLLHNIQKSSPFFICLLGQQYGPYLDESKSISSAASSSRSRHSNWVEKNLLVASQTGYNHLVNQFTYENSFLEHQINLALLNEDNFNYYRFYYRQSEFLDTKFEHLSIEERKEAFSFYEAENDYCDSKIKDLKLKIAKKGIIVKYYDSLEQLHEYIYEDMIEMIRDHVRTHLRLNQSKLEWEIDILKSHKLANYVLTDSSVNLLMKLDSFCQSSFMSEENTSLIATSDFERSRDAQELIEKNEYKEILKLRHANISSSNTNSDLSIGSKQNMFIIQAPKGFGKTSFILHIYENLRRSMYRSILSQEILQDRSMTERTNSARSKKSSSTDSKKEIKPFYLFYFLRPNDSIVAVLIDIICKMRLKYTNKDSSNSLNNELHDNNSIVEQFHATLGLGPSIIFIDGLSEIESQNQPIKLSLWLPKNIETHTKFIITLRKATASYSELSSYKSSVLHNLIVFKSEDDYQITFAKLLNAETNSNSFDNKNTLFSKFQTIYSILKSANHSRNPLFIQLIAKELFCFDNEIYRSHPIHHRKSIASTLFSSDTRSSLNMTENNLIDSYIEDVSTIREVIQKIIMRYVTKRYNWSTRTTLPISKENSGWVGETLCLIALSVHGISKSSLFNILRNRGYVNELVIDELNWQIFRMQFGFFIFEGLNGVLKFSHDYFKEAVQALLLNGLNIISDAQSDPNLPPCKQNISEIQKDMHISIIIDILKNQIKKDEFDFSCQIDNNSEADSLDLSEKFLKILLELIYHLYMIYDLVNLCKFLTNFKVLHIFNENRSKHLFEWFNFCNYLKLTTNLNVVRVILLSSFTIGMPNYEIIVKDENLYFKIINGNNTENESTTVESQTMPPNEFLNETMKSSNSKRQFQEKLITNLQSQSSSSFENNIEKSANSITSIGVINELYEPYIDELLDLSDIVDLSESEYGDTVNLTLINRALILLDLMRNLEDKYFQENFAFKLGKLIDNIVTQNYPLNDTEKLKYTLLLEALANIAIHISDYESALRYFIKCIELLDDLYLGFNTVELNKKYKTKIQLLQLSNRLSILHSNMGLLLLKMNNLNAANAVLSKANRFSSDITNTITANLQLDYNIKEKTKKLDIELKVKNDKDKLIHQQSPVYKLKNMFKRSFNFKYEDAGILDAKFTYFFISGLYEVQSMNFQNANTYFEQALQLTKKWFGQHHLNTSKIYHYYGCFYSLQNMKFFNPRRAELYLRKALSIREKFKESPTAEYKLKNNFLSAVSTNMIITGESYLHTERSLEQNSIENFSSRTKLESMDKNNSNKLMRSEEKNNISEILFDLGCLLSSYESSVSKKEALDYIRRALDIKVLQLGPNHADCLIIKKKLNEIVLEYSTPHIRVNTRSGTPTSRKMSSKSLTLEITPKTKLKKYLQEINKQADFQKFNGGYNELDFWIEKNSIIEKIPSKIDRSIMNAEKLRRQMLSQENDRSFDEQFMRSFDYNDESQMTKTTNRDSTDRTACTTERVETKLNKLTKVSSVLSSRAKLAKSKSFHNVKNAPLNLRKERTTLESIHSRNCKCPTALSVDIHNSKTITGPHSSIKTLLNPSVINTSEHDNASYKPPKVQHKVLKHIYYKSVWYDLPPGSSMRRFKNYVKVSPNA